MRDNALETLAVCLNHESHAIIGGVCDPPHVERVFRAANAVGPARQSRLAARSRP
jgi:hypothetical protein